MPVTEPVAPYYNSKYSGHQDGEISKFKNAKNAEWKNWINTI